MSRGSVPRPQTREPTLEAPPLRVCEQRRAAGQEGPARHGPARRGDSGRQRVSPGRRRSRGREAKAPGQGAGCRRARKRAENWEALSAVSGSRTDGSGLLRGTRHRRPTGDAGIEFFQLEAAPAGFAQVPGALTSGGKEEEGAPGGRDTSVSWRGAATQSPEGCPGPFRKRLSGAAAERG